MLVFAPPLIAMHLIVMLGAGFFAFAVPKAANDYKVLLLLATYCGLMASMLFSAAHCDRIRLEYQEALLKHSILAQEVDVYGNTNIRWATATTTTSLPAEKKEGTK